MVAQSQASGGGTGGMAIWLVIQLERQRPSPRLMVMVLGIGNIVRGSLVQSLLHFSMILTRMAIQSVQQQYVLPDGTPLRVYKAIGTG